jgi:hypothetical protein
MREVSGNEDNHLSSDVDVKVPPQPFTASGWKKNRHGPRLRPNDPD